MTTVARYPDLSGKVVLVTGSSTGIGLGIAYGVLAAGGSVCVCARQQDRLAAAAEGLRAVSPERLLVIPGDVTDEAVIDGIVSTCIERFGRIDGCVANAGIDSVTPLHEMPLTEWRRVLAGNLDSAFLAARAFVRALLAGETGGSFVAVSSVAARRGRAGRAHYVAAKAGLVALTRSLAVEYGGLGIRANVVMPGSVETDMAREAPDWEAIRSRVASRTPLGRPGQVAELAGIVVYLLSDLSTFHTGDVISVDGGMSAT
jgi:NAD(P)-dependent dehydrogenase (short-subunit alcohol dehydrogenase family)